jgi:pimeloyl-ACP methyl ester carboxylesterase
MPAMLDLRTTEADARAPLASSTVPGQRIERRRGRIGSVDLHWVELGAGSPVILVHGFTRSHRVWLPVARRLAKHHRVYALDLPGAGGSGRPDAPYTLEWHAERVDEWMGHLGLTNVDAAGHSYGGAVLQWLLIVNRARLRRVALVSSGGLGTEVTLALRLASLPGILARVADPAVAVADALLARWPTGPLKLARSWVSDNAAPGTGRALGRAVRNVIDVRGQRRSFYDYTNLIDELPPMRVFWGAEDRTIPASHGERLASALDHCDFVAFPGCGHSPPRERPRELSRELLDFFGEPSLPTPKFLNSALS